MITEDHNAKIKAALGETNLDDKTLLEFLFPIVTPSKITNAKEAMTDISTRLRCIDLAMDSVDLFSRLINRDELRDSRIILTIAKKAYDQVRLSVSEQAVTSQEVQ